MKIKSYILPFAICTLLFTFLGCSCGQNVGPSGVGKVVGVVTDDQTQKPIEGVKVSCDEVTASTKTDGGYEITLAAGTRELTFSKDGYEPKTLSVVVIQNSNTTLNANLSAKATVVARIEFSPTSFTLKIGETKKFEVKAYDSNNNLIQNITPEFTLDPASVGSIAQDGTFTAKDEAEGTLTVKVNTASATASIVVEGNYPAGPPHLIKSWAGPTDPGSLTVENNILYVDTELSSKILKYDLEGNLVGSIGSRGAGQEQFDGILALRATYQGLFVSEGNNYRIQKLDLSGKFQMMFGTEAKNPDYPTGKLFWVRDLAIDSTGKIYTIEGSGMIYEPQRVQIWDQNGNWITAWGKRGNGQGEFYGARGICLSPDEKEVLVSDTENRRIQRFDTSGNYLGQWATGERPCGIVWEKTRRIYYVLIGTKAIAAYTRNGKLLFTWSTLNDSVSGYPIDVDGQGNIYTVGYDSGKVVKYGY